MADDDTKSAILSHKTYVQTSILSKIRVGTHFDISVNTSQRFIKRKTTNKKDKKV